MKCKICGSAVSNVFSHRVRNNDIAEYMLCTECDYMFVANPSWLAEAYSKPIDASDTGYVMRNIFLSRKTLILLIVIFGAKKVSKYAFIDYAGGYGMLTRIMRDYGYNFFWDDLYTQNLFAHGFEYSKADLNGTKALTCFECFEHFVEPISEIEKMLAISDTIFFSTVLKPIGVVPSPEWEYYGFNHGQHISFYSRKTFEYVAKKYGLNFYTDNSNLHILTKRKLPKKIMHFVNGLTKIHSDVFLRKLLTSRTTADQKNLIEKGL